MELFEDETQEEQRVTLDDLHGVPEKALSILTRLARFHQVQNLSFNRRDRVWTATDSEGIQPFIIDAKHVTSAAGMGSRMTSEGTGYAIDRDDRAEFSPEDIEKIKNAPFPDMARSNLRIKRKQDKDRAQRATWSDNGGGESNLGSPVGSSSSNDY